MASFLAAVDRVTGARRTMSRLADALGKPDAPGGPPRDLALAQYLNKVRDEGNPPVIKDGTGTAVGGAAGFALGLATGHPFLGTIGGASVGRNVPALLDSNLRRDALCNMGQTATAIVMARILSGAPITGFVIGWLLAGGAIYLKDWRSPEAPPQPAQPLLAAPTGP